MHADENPYAPPQATAVGIPDAPRAFGWELEGSVVWVKNISLFPMIDPYTGNSSETMMLQQMEIRHRPRWLLVFPALGAALGFASDTTGAFSDQGPIALMGAILGWFLAFMIGRFFPVCTLRLFFEKRTVRMRKIIGKVLGGLFLLFFPGVILFSFGPQWLQVVPQFALVCGLIGGFFRLVLSRRLRCVRRNDGRFEIRGFHRRALESLARET